MERLSFLIFTKIYSDLTTMPQHDLTLARYTCVALQRLNGSAKKIKGLLIIPLHNRPIINVSIGSLLDKTLRIEMDNAIFHKLQDVIEQPCRSKDWFALAEQVINTIYALGEHPDRLCNTLIKHMTVRAFSRPWKVQEAPATASECKSVISRQSGMETSDSRGSSPAPQSQTQEERDVGDAFELSQLLFFVGHVALKHIVFLELIEREWKRQKDEKQTGIPSILSRMIYCSHDVADKPAA